MIYYNTITELPLREFIKCVVDNNIYALLKNAGEAVDIQVLNKAWSEILDQYHDAIGDAEHQMYTLLYKEVSLLTIDYTIISQLLPVLETIYHKKFADEINEILDTSFEFDWSNQEKYRHEIQRCVNRSKAIKIQLELKKTEFEAIENKNKSNTQKPTREYFISVLINLSNHAKYQISDGITVFEFCSRIKQLNEYLKSLEKIQSK